MFEHAPWLPRDPAARWLVLAVLGVFVLLRQGLLLLLVLVVSAFSLWQNPRVQGWAMVNLMRHELRQPTQMPPEPSLKPETAGGLATNASGLQVAADLFRVTNVWNVHLRFTSNQWASLGPTPVPPVFHFIQPDGSVILRNPKALRNGLAGVLGIDLPWSQASLEFGDVVLSEVGARFKGNGTFVNSQRSYKRPYKIDLSRGQNSGRIAGRTVLNFHNLTADNSCLSDTLAYEFFRNAGVPAPRTSFARLRLTVQGRFEGRLLGLYVMVENPDREWAREQFGVGGVALFKPVTYELFKDLGEDWKAYNAIYDPKTNTKPEQQQRIIQLAKLMTHASDVEFAAQVGELIDIEEFARFLACEVILSNYDGILSNGQNFLLYLDPRTNRIGFIPWDLDHCWGEFPLVGTKTQREQASLWHPWLGENRFLERMLAAEPVRECYRRELQHLRETLFVPERLGHRVDEVAALVRPFVAEESPQRLSRFETTVGGGGTAAGRDGSPPQAEKWTFSLKGFFAARAVSVTDQLEGRSQGMVIGRKPSH
jgi:spore coat protein H